MPYCIDMQRGCLFLLPLALGSVLFGLAPPAFPAVAPSSSRPPDGPAALVSPVPSSGRGSGCSSSTTGGRSVLHIQFQGRERLVVVYAPKDAGNKALPLVLNLHGSGSTAAGQEVFSGMDDTAQANGFIVAYPQGLITSGSGYDWDIPGAALFGGAKLPKNAPNDVQFLTNLPATLSKSYCVDSHRVYVTGMSGGGRMASQLGCDASQVFAAVAPVAGLRYPNPCPTTRSVPVVAFHGTADPVDPYNGHGQAYWTYSVPEAASLWAAHDSCKTSVRTVKKGFVLRTYSSCAGRAEVELYSVSGEGHEWPGGPHMPVRITFVLGRQSNAVNADDVMWDFFQRWSTK